MLSYACRRNKSRFAIQGTKMPPMQPMQFRVDPKMIPPVVMAMGFGAALIFLEGTSRRGILLIVILAPLFYLGAEILARRISVDARGMSIFKLLRSTRIDWPDVDSVDAIKTGNKLFLIVQKRDGRASFVTNTIRPFKELTDRILQAVGPERIADSVREILANPPTKHGPMIQAWLVCIVLGILVAAKILGYSS